MRSLATRIVDKVKASVLIKHWGGGGNYEEIGQEFLRHFISAGLKPHHRVLEIGCGAGRMAAPLVNYLEGSYVGIDISERAIRYCEQTIKHPRFSFLHADLFNQSYNTNGRSAAGYTFPFADGSFDFIFLTSVFTHLLREEVSNYMSEIGRLLKSGGISFSTWYLLMEIEKPYMPLTRFDDVSLVKSLKEPTKAIAYDHFFVVELCSLNLLVIRDIHLGSWARSKGLSWQDIIVTVKS